MMDTKKCPIVLITVIILLRPVIAASSDGDEFSNNLISDLAPLLSLFGEQVTKQFMSQSMGWADHFIFAMVPLGVITAITGAIRVGGPGWLKAIIGRARENIAAAEVELMSSTSHEVGELWNGQQIVRTMGMPPVKDILFLSQGGKYGLLSSIEKALDEKHLIEIGRFDIQEDNAPVAEGHHGAGHRAGQANNSENPVQRPRPTQKPRSSLENSPAPNISLNLHNHVRRTEIRVVAAIAIVIQACIVIYAGFATYHPKLRYKKGDSTVQTYAFPVMCSGTVIISIGLLICAHVIEDSTTERRYEVLKREDEGAIEVRGLWLQKGERVADQSFESFAIFSKGVRETITTSERKNGWGDTLEKKNKATLKSQPKMSNSYDIYPFTGFIATTGSIISLCGFILQFTGLRALHWSVSLAQLGGMLAMTALRAYVRRGLTRRPVVQSLPKGFEIDWLATRSSALHANWPKDRHSESSKPPSLRKKQEVDDDHFWSEGFWNPPWHTTAPLDPQNFDEIKKARMRLHILTGWRSSVFAEAKALACAIDVVLNSLSRSLQGSPQGSMSTWSLSIQSFGNQQVIINATQNGEGKWETDIDEIDSVLSLWVYDAMQIPERGDLRGGITRSRLGDSDGSTSVAGSGNKGIWLLGPDEAALRRDLKWWSDDTVVASLVLAREERFIRWGAGENQDSTRITIEAQRILGCGSIKDPRRPAGFVISDIGEKPQNEDGLKYQLAVLSSAPLALLGAQKILSEFMKVVATRLTIPIQGKSSVRHADTANLSAGSSSWQSFTLQNTKLVKLVQDVQKTGIGSLHEVYLCIIPPLSASERLPDASAVIEFARQRSEQYELHGQWDRSADIHIWLFRTGQSFTSSNIFARKTTATVMVFFRSALIEEENSADHDIRMVTDGSTTRDASRAVTKLRQELKGHELGYSLNVLKLFLLQRKTNSRGRNAPLDWAPLSLEHGQPVDVSDQSFKDSIRFTKLHNLCFFEPPSDSNPVDDQIRSPDILGLSPVHYAASPMASDHYPGDKTYVSVLLGAGADGNAKDLAGWTPLHYNCLLGGAAQFRELMSEGLDIETRARDGTTLLHCAAIGNNPTAARRLIEAGVNIKARDSSRSTPLHWAAYYGNLGVLNVLVQAGGVKERNNDGRTPAHLAALGGHVDALKVILGEVSSMEDKDRSGFTILHFAAAKGHARLIEFLVGAEEVTDIKVVEGAPPENSSSSARNANMNTLPTRRTSNIEAADAKGFRPLHWAANAYLGDAAGRILVAQGADIHATDEGGRTPLDICALSGNAELARYLKSKGARIDASSDATGEALRHVARTGDLQTLKALFNNQGRPGDHLFHRSIEAGNLDSIRFLILEHANMAASDSDPEGATALHIAAGAKECPEIVVRLLADHEADLNARDRSGQAVVHKAVRLGHYDLVKFLIDKKVDLNAKDRDGDTALHTAVSRGSSKMLKLLAEGGADVNLCNNDGRTALHDTARLYKPKLMAILVGIKGADINVQDVSGMTALHHIASLRQRGRLSRAIALLIKKGANTDLKDKYDSTPIHTAALYGESDSLYTMIDKGADLKAKDKHGWTVMHIAALKHDSNMIGYLVDRGASINTKDKRGKRAIHCTVTHNLDCDARTIWRSVNALIVEGADINAQDSYGRTVLNLALITRPININHLVRMLILNSAADVKITDKLKRTILHYSSFMIENSLVKIFIAQGADLNALDKRGYTALHFACFEGDPDFVRFLIDEGADVNARIGCWTALHLVILSSLTRHRKEDCGEIAFTLIEKGVDRSVKDQDGRTAHDMAAILGERDLLRALDSDSELPDIPLGSNEGVGEIADEQPVVDGQDIPLGSGEGLSESADKQVVADREDTSLKGNKDVSEFADEQVSVVGKDIPLGGDEVVNESPDEQLFGDGEDTSPESNEVVIESTNKQIVVDRRSGEGVSEIADEQVVGDGGDIPLGRDEVVSESADKQVVVDGRSDEGVSASTSGGLSESTDGGVGESTDGDVGESTREGFSESPDKQIVVDGRSDEGASGSTGGGLSESTDGDVGESTHESVSESPDKQIVVDGRSGEGVGESTDEQIVGDAEDIDGQEAISGEDITLGREVVSGSGDEQVTIVGKDKKKLIKAANEIFAHIRKYREKKDIDVV